MVSGMEQWVDYMNDHYIELYGPELLVFKLDKTRTIVDDILLEETHSRIYLPPFKLKGLHQDMKFTGGLGLWPYTETPDSDFICMVNFNRMIKKHEELRIKDSCLLKVKYVGTEKCEMQLDNRNFMIFKDGILFDKFNVDDYKNMSRLTTHLNTYTDIQCSIEGENELTTKLKNFNKIQVGSDYFLALPIKDNTYENITDVIELGDVIITNKNKIYEVTDARPDGEFGWEYAMYRIACSIADVTKIALPGNYVNNAVGKGGAGSLKRSVYME